MSAMALIQSGYPSENIIFSDLPEVDRPEVDRPEVDRKVKRKVSAGSSDNLRKNDFPNLHARHVLLLQSAPSLVSEAAQAMKQR